MASPYTETRHVWRSWSEYHRSTTNYFKPLPSDLSSATRPHYRLPHPRWHRPHFRNWSPLPGTPPPPSRPSLFGFARFNKNQAGSFFHISGSTKYGPQVPLIHGSMSHFTVHKLSLILYFPKSPVYSCSTGSIGIEPALEHLPPVLNSSKSTQVHFGPLKTLHIWPEQIWTRLAKSVVCYLFRTTSSPHDPRFV